MNRALPLAVAATVSLVTSAASAQTAPAGPSPAEGAGELRLAVSVTERGLTLPKMILNPELDFDFVRVPGGSLFANLSAGASFGVLDDLTVRAQVLPLQLAGPAGTGFHYGQATGLLGVDNVGPGVGATYRFLKGKFELGGSLDANIITVSGTSGVVLQPGVPAHIHITEALRIDTGAYLPLTFASVSVLGPSASHNSVGLAIPGSVLYDITEAIHVGGGTGFEIVDFSDAGHTVAVPLGVFGGYAIAGKNGPILDIDPFFWFPAFLTPGAPGSATGTGLYTVGVSVGGFIYL